MMLWLILTLMTIAMAVYVSLPFLAQQGPAPATTTSDVALLKDQLAEIDRDEAAGTLDAAAATAARLEVKRRLLAVERAAAESGPARPLSAVEYQYAFLSLTGLAVLGSVLLYGLVGSPALPAGGPGATAATLGGRSAPEDAGTVITKLAAKAKANPNDLEAWGMLGWSYFRTGKYAEAVAAYRHAEKLAPSSANVKSGLTQALIRQAGGTVTPEAMAKVNEVLAIDPKEPGARFNKGLAKLQAGDAKAAIDDWITQLKEAGPADAWAGELRQRVAEVAAENRVDISGRLPPPQAPAPATSASNAAAPGPTAADVEAAQSMTPEDRTAMIRGMVSGLAAKLQADPTNVDGWTRLIRSYSVLGDTAAAKTAYRHAVTALSQDPKKLAQITALAQEFGLGP